MIYAINYFLTRFTGYNHGHEAHSIDHNKTHNERHNSSQNEKHDDNSNNHDKGHIHHQNHQTQAYEKINDQDEDHSDHGHSHDSNHHDHHTNENNKHGNHGNHVEEYVERDHTGKISESKHSVDNNMRAAFVHVLADAVVSVIIIIALFIASSDTRFAFLDSTAAIVGSMVIFNWAYVLMGKCFSLMY